MKIDAAYYSSIGGRAKNEDTILLTKKKNGIIAIVADGVGGQSNGEIASKMVADIVTTAIEFAEASENMLNKAILLANKSIYEMNKSYSTNMMSTVAALWISGQNAFIGNVGDSRVYQFRDKQIEYQSHDHSFAQLAVDSGEISQHELRAFPARNRLTKALGYDDYVKSDIDRIKVIKGDSLLLCSDGFWEYIYEDEMIELHDICETADEWLFRMRDCVKNRSGNKSDNNSAIAIKIVEIN